MKNRKQTNELLSILFILFFYPFGIPFMFATESFTKKTRWKVTLIFFGAILFGIGALIILNTSSGYAH